MEKKYTLNEILELIKASHAEMHHHTVHYLAGLPENEKAKYMQGWDSAHSQLGFIFRAEDSLNLFDREQTQ